MDCRASKFVAILLRIVASQEGLDHLPTPTGLPAYDLTGFTYLTARQCRFKFSHDH
jgi:hypothetical protein